MDNHGISWQKSHKKPNKTHFCRDSEGSAAWHQSNLLRFCCGSCSVFRACSLITVDILRLQQIESNVRLVRFPGWQGTQAGEREIKKALRKALFKYKLHADEDLFDKAYTYIRQYY